MHAHMEYGADRSGGRRPKHTTWRAVRAARPGTSWERRAVRAHRRLPIDRGRRAGSRSEDGRREATHARLRALNRIAWCGRPPACRRGAIDVFSYVTVPTSTSTCPAILVCITLSFGDRPAARGGRGGGEGGLRNRPSACVRAAPAVWRVVELWLAHAAGASRSRSGGGNAAPTRQAPRPCHPPHDPYCCCCCCCSLRTDGRHACTRARPCLSLVTTYDDDPIPSTYYAATACIGW